MPPQQTARLPMSGAMLRDTAFQMTPRFLPMLRLTSPLGLIALVATSAMAQEAPAPAPRRTDCRPEQCAAQRRASRRSGGDEEPCHVPRIGRDARAATRAAPNSTSPRNMSRRNSTQQGLRPAGDDGSYLQKVPLVSYKPADKGSMAFTRQGRPAGQPRLRRGLSSRRQSEQDRHPADCAGGVRRLRHRRARSAATTTRAST